MSDLDTPLLDQALVSVSDLLDGQLRLRLEAYREGYQRGHQAGYAAGRQDLADEFAEAWNDIARPVTRADPALQRRRWTLRGEQRTRETFGRPHRDDFTGRGAA
jgi:hypothetical protein